MKIIKRIFKYFFIPYKYTILVYHRNGNKYYCERTAHAVFKSNNSTYEKPKFRAGRYKLREGVWNLFPLEGIGYIPFKDILDWEVLTTEEQFNVYKDYRLNFYKSHKIELYLPRQRSSLTNEYLDWLNTPRIQEMIRIWVDGYGYSDAYNWESPNLLMERIWTEAAIKYGGEKVIKLMEHG